MRNKPHNIYGVGVNYRADISKDILNHLDKIDLIEVFTEKFFIKDDDTTLQEIIKNKPVVLHGLDISIGSSDNLSEEYLKNLSQTLNEVDCAWFSDHIALTQQDGVEVGHLMPVQFSESSAENIISKVNAIQKITNKPFILENITYYESIQPTV